MPDAHAPIPAFVNTHSGSAHVAVSALSRDTRFALQALAVQKLADAIAVEAAKRTPRVLVCGGDGTIATAIAAAADTPVDIAVFPGGTLNHFARDLGLPLDNARAVLDIAATGGTTPVDLGYVNGRAILNTSSVGDYVDFVRHREAGRRWLGYPLASLFAALPLWIRPRSVVAEIRSEQGSWHRYRTPLIFVAVGERVLQRHAMGQRVRGGVRSFHVFVINEQARRRLGAVAFGVLQGRLIDYLNNGEITAHLVSNVTAVMEHSAGTIAIDGELIPATSPLRYEFRRAAANVVSPRV